MIKLTSPSCRNKIDTLFGYENKIGLGIADTRR
jgi:hypothetical protein